MGTFRQLKLEPEIRLDPPEAIFPLLNAIRGIAAILIVGRHTALFSPIISPMSFIAVDLFFLLSGVVIEASYRDKLVNGMSTGRFFWIRIARIYPLYILGTFITITAMILAGRHLFIGMARLQIDRPALQILAAVFLVPLQIGPKAPMYIFDHPAWSLFFELVINVFYALLAVRLNNRMLVGLIAFFGLTLLASLAYFSPHVEIGYRGGLEYIAGFARTGISFFFGVALYRAGRSDFIRRNSAAATAVVIGGVVLGLMMVPGKAWAIWYYLFCVFFFFPALVFVALSVESGAVARRVWDFLGDLSYAIYALHVPVLIFISSVLIVPYQKHHLAANLAVRLAYVITLFGIAYGADKTYDKAVRNWMKELRWPGRRMVADEPAQ
jgi:peptidoglycan/LPS O-acetylase OafA/YrhL